jgi:hypothetical protein
MLHTGAMLVCLRIEQHTYTTILVNIQRHVFVVVAAYESCTITALTW